MVRVDILRSLSIGNRLYEEVVLYRPTRFLIHCTQFNGGNNELHKKREFPSQEEMVRRFPCAEEKQGWFETGPGLGYSVTPQDYADARVRMRSRLAAESGRAVDEHLAD